MMELVYRWQTHQTVIAESHHAMGQNHRAVAILGQKQPLIFVMEQKTTEGPKEGGEDELL